MALVNVLAVRLEAVTAAFQSGIKAANSALDQMKGAFARASSGLQSFLERNNTLGKALGNLKNAIAGVHPAAALGVAAVAGLGLAMRQAVRESVALAGELLTVSQRTGESVETLSELKFVAEQNNTNFGDLTIGLRNLQRIQTAAIKGSKDAAKAFKDVGLSVDDIRGKKASELLEGIADGLAATSDASARTSKSFELLGRSGPALVPFLGQGSEAIRKAREEAIRFGAQISSTFAAQADDYEDNLAKMRTLQRALGLQIAQVLVPALNQLFAALFQVALKAMPAISKALSNLTFSVIQGVAAWNVYAGIVEKITASIIGNAAAWDKGQEKYLSGIKILSMTKEEWLAQQAAMLDAVPAMEKVGDETEKLVNALKMLADEFDESGKKAEEGVSAVVSLGQKYVELGVFGRKNLDDLLSRLRAMLPASEDAARALNLITQAQEAAGPGAALAKGEELTRRRILARIADEEKRQEEARRKARESGAVTGPEGLLPVPKLDVSDFESVNAGILAGWEETFQSMTDIASEAFQGFATLADGFADALTSGADIAKVRFGDFFKKLLRDLAKAIVRALILKAIVGFFGGLGLGGLLEKIGSFLGVEFKTQGQEGPFEGGVLGSTAIARRALVAGAAPAVGAGGTMFRPTVVVNEATPRTWIEITDRHVVPRIRTRLRTMGESDFTRGG